MINSEICQMDYLSQLQVFLLNTVMEHFSYKGGHGTCVMKCLKEANFQLTTIPGLAEAVWLVSLTNKVQK